MKNLLLVFILWTGGAGAAEVVTGEVLVWKVEEFSGGGGDRSLGVRIRGRLPGYETVNALSIARPDGMDDARWEGLARSFQSAAGRVATVKIEAEAVAVRGPVMRLWGAEITVTAHPAQAQGPAGNTVLAETPLGDGRRKAVAFRREGVTHVSILPANAGPPEGPGNVFIAPTDTDYSVESKSGRLAITGEMPAPDDEVLRRREYEGVRIDYRDQITSEARGVRLTGVETSGDGMLTVRFTGTWEPPPVASRARLPRSLPQPTENAIIFMAKTAGQKGALAALAERFRAVEGRQVGLTIRHANGMTFHGATPIFTEAAEVGIEER